MVQALKNKNTVLIAICLGTILSIRVINIYFNGVWIDEAMDYYTAKDTSILNLLTVNHMDAAHPPLFPIIHKFFTFGTIDYILLRWVSLFFSAIGLVQLFKAINQYSLKHEHLAYFALLAIGFSHIFVPIHILAQSYALTFMLSCFCISLTLNNLFKPNKDLSRWGFIPIGVLFFSTFFMDFSGLWILLSLFIYSSLIFAFKKTSFENYFFIFKSFLIALILFLIWSPYFIASFDQIKLLESYIQETGYNHENPWIEPLRFWSDHLSGIPLNPWLTSLPFRPVHMSFAFIGVGFLGLILFTYHNLKLGLLFLCLMLVPITTSHVYSVVAEQALFHPRNLWPYQLGLVLGYCCFCFYTPRLFFLKSGGLVSTALLLCLCSLYFQKFPSLGFRPKDVTGDYGLTPTLAQNLEQNKKVLLFSNHKPWRLYNFKFLLDSHGIDAEMIDLSHGVPKEKLKSNPQVVLFNHYKLPWHPDEDFEKQRIQNEKDLHAIAKEINCTPQELTIPKIPEIFLRLCQ